MEEKIINQRTHQSVSTLVTVVDGIFNSAINQRFNHYPVKAYKRIYKIVLYALVVVRTIAVKLKIKHTKIKKKPDWVKPVVDEVPEANFADLHAMMYAPEPYFD